MISWTNAGAVPTPRVVQIRVQRSYPGRIRAGAPVPTRSMSAAEVFDNINYFTVGLDTPRTSPCTTLVMSGVGVAGRPETCEAIDLARAQGIERVILHAGVEDLPRLEVKRFADRVDVLVIPVRPGGGTLSIAGGIIAAAVEAGLQVATNTVLSDSALPLLPAVARVLAAARPSRITFTYPFPINGGDSAHVPSPPRAVAALRKALRILDGAGLDVGLKGLPVCLLGAQAHRLGRTANRWYVDADHQRAEALSFFPDVVSFYKEDVCRFCVADRRCDGFFATYLRRPGFPALEPLSEETDGPPHP
jgi:hypothetical protein